MRIATCCALALALLSGPALASDAPDGIISAPASEGGKELDAAAQHFALGVDFFRAGNYDAARVEFEAAYGLSHQPDLLHNLSMIAERQGRLADAIKLEEQFLSAPRDLPLSEREADEAQGRLVRLRAQLKQPAPPPPSGGATIARTAPTERPRIPPGSIGLMVGGGVALLAGIGCGGAAYASARGLESQPVTMAEYGAATDRGRALDRAGIALDVVGGVALVAGAGWALWARSHGRSAQTAALHLRQAGQLAIVW